MILTNVSIVFKQSVMKLELASTCCFASVERQIYRLEVSVIYMLYIYITCALCYI